MRECRCTPAIIQRYLGKISGPLLDRLLQLPYAQPPDSQTMRAGGFRRGHTRNGGPPHGTFPRAPTTVFSKSRAPSQTWASRRPWRPSMWPRRCSIGAWIETTGRETYPPLMAGSTVFGVTGIGIKVTGIKLTGYETPKLIGPLARGPDFSFDFGGCLGQVGGWRLAHSHACRNRRY
jgi:hypothetical protein